MKIKLKNHDSCFQNSQWVNYKSLFSKEYATDAEESRRFDIWAANLDMVETHNQEAAEGLHRYSMAINQFSDLTYEEFEKTMLGYHQEDSQQYIEYFQVAYIINLFFKIIF